MRRSRAAQAALHTFLLAGGSAAGVSGTPGNIIYTLKTQKGQELSGAQPFPSFQSAIDAALKS